MRVTALVVRLCIVASASVVVSKAQGQGQAGKRLDVKVGECSMRLMQSELDLLKPKGKGQLVWVGPCANGFIHGFGVLLMERTDADGVTYRNAAGYDVSDGVLGRPHYPAYIAGDGTFRRDDSQTKDPVKIQRAEIPAWASFIAGRGEPTASEKQAVREYLKKEVAAAPASAQKAGSAVAQTISDDQVQSIADACRFYPAFVRETVTHFIGTRTEKAAISELEKTKKTIEDYIKAHGASYSENRRLREHSERIQLLNCMIDTKLTVASLKSGKSAPVAKNVLVDVGNGCKAYLSAPRPGERYSWIGPCMNGLTEGLGYWIFESGNARSIWRQTNKEGYLLDDGPGYSNLNGIQRQRSNSDGWEPTTTGDMPAWARNFVVDNKRPARPRQPEEVAAAAKQSSEASLKAQVDKTRVTASASASGADWIAIGPSYEIDAASLSVVMGRNGMLSVYERGKGSTQARRLYVTCEPFTWGENQYGMRPVDHSVDYQVDLAREVCRRSTLASTRQITPTYANPPYQTLMNQGQHAEAFEAAKKLAESGNAAWTRTVAWHYWEGKGVAQDYAEGTRLHRRAAEGGDALAMNQLGWALQNGRGIAQDQSAAIPWLKRSAELGNSSAMINLAWAYQGGNGVAQDLNLALRYANQAKSQNNRDADSYISSIRNQMTQTAADEAEAREGIERRRREDEEDERQARREARAAQEARDRQWTDMATTIIGGAAAMKRQQDEQNARRETERRRIEADNARYRQQRADEDRRWLEQNQRQQQAALERQRADQERQRIQQARIEEERRRPRKERVNLPKHSGCIRLEWDRDKPQENSRWYTLQNGCAQTLTVHWCDRPGCQRSTMAATIPGGGSNRGWVLKKNGLAISVMAACQMDNGGGEVYYNNTENQCWTWVTMN